MCAYYGNNVSIRSFISIGFNMAIEYFPGSRLGVVSILKAFGVVARLVQEFAPRIRAAFPEATNLLAFLAALEAAAALLIAAQGDFDAVASPPAESDSIDWGNLPGNLNS
jgi:hypothetical protein